MNLCIIYILNYRKEISLPLYNLTFKSFNKIRIIVVTSIWRVFIWLYLIFFFDEFFVSNFFFTLHWYESSPYTWLFVSLRGFNNVCKLHKDIIRVTMEDSSKDVKGSIVIEEPSFVYRVILPHWFLSNYFPTKCFQTSPTSPWVSSVTSVNRECNGKGPDCPRPLLQRWS